VPDVVVAKETESVAVVVALPEGDVPVAREI
jgi:hypothetical protein